LAVLPRNIFKTALRPVEARAAEDVSVPVRVANVAASNQGDLLADSEETVEC
jgi:hypothetical protein